MDTFLPIVIGAIHSFIFLLSSNIYSLFGFPCFLHHPSSTFLLLATLIQDCPAAIPQSRGTA